MWQWLHLQDATVDVLNLFWENVKEITLKCHVLLNFENVTVKQNIVLNKSITCCRRYNIGYNIVLGNVSHS